MLAAGLARILVPYRFDGYGLDFDTWFEVVLSISKVDASHGWCASLIIHHVHLIGQFSEEAQQAVWAAVPMSRSLLHLRQQRRQSASRTAIASQVSVPLSPAASRSSSAV
jgi:hypothetical protein